MQQLKLKRIPSAASTQLGAPYIENLTPQVQKVLPFDARHGGIDFYIDSIRFMPDNVTSTKLTIQTVNNNLEQVFDTITALPDLNSSAYSPEFAFRNEYRTRYFDPTTTIIIQIETIDSREYKNRVVGFAPINLFLDKYGQDQPTDPQLRDFQLNKGCFQIPVYCQTPFSVIPFTVETGFKRLEKIPACTVLVRIRDAVRSEDGVKILGTADVPQHLWYELGIVIPAPKYGGGVYNTKYCSPGQQERKLYEQRLKRYEMSVRDATSKLQLQTKKRFARTDHDMLL